MVLGNSEPHQVCTYASQCLLTVGLWARAHGCFVEVYTQVGPLGLVPEPKVVLGYDVAHMWKMLKILHMRNNEL